MYKISIKINLHCFKISSTISDPTIYKCGTGIIPSLFPFEHLGRIIQVSQWKSVTIERSAKDNKTQKDLRIKKKVTESKTLTDTMDILMKQLKTFFVHNYTNITQLKKEKLYGPFLWMGFNCLKA